MCCEEEWLEEYLREHAKKLEELRGKAKKLEELTGTALPPLHGLEAYWDENVVKPILDRSMNAYGLCLGGIEELFARKDADAVWQLARVAELATERLEILSRQNPTLVKPVAEQMTEWPVNLSLDRAKRVQRLKVAKTYIKDLNVNANPLLVSTKRSGRDNESPYQCAARILHGHLNRLRNGSFKTKRKTLWLKKLKKLDSLSPETVKDWWELGQQWLKLVWMLEWPNPRSFERLIDRAEEVLPYNPKLDNSSDIAREVIDNRLKQAFKALAK